MDDELNPDANINPKNQKETLILNKIGALTSNTRLFHTSGDISNGKSLLFFFSFLVNHPFMYSKVKRLFKDKNTRKYRNYLAVF